MEFTRNFKQLAKDDVDIAGGKGASLGEMTKAGIPVPGGFVVLSGAFERFLEETDLHSEIDSILHKVDHKKIHTVENASEEIKVLILEAKMPSDIASEIKKEFKKLNSKYIAVRSSATAEDSSVAAWAGQLESYLNTTEDDLLEKVQHCWASLFTPRAIFYRFEKGLHEQHISVAVVIQKMIQSEVSGIAFSVHPVTQDYNQLIIEAGLGLGEAIVSGSITPDSYVVEKQPRRIADKNISEQARGLFRSATSGNEWRDISKEMGEKQVLSDNHILQLSDIVLNIEKHYGFPCDIEWALENGKFYIVQSRPITTLTSDKDKKFIRVFKKFFTRSVPLALIEYWHKGEYEALKKMLQGATHFNPLFIRHENGKVDVYYDINNDDTALQPLINFVLKKPQDFYKLADQYEKSHSEFLRLLKTPNLKIIQKTFDLLLELWGFMPILVQIGELENSALDKKLVKRALELRTKSQDKDAQVERFLSLVIKKYYPRHFKFWDVLRLSEIISSLLPSFDELKKRQQGFMFFEQNLISNTNKKVFEKEYSVELDEDLAIIGDSSDEPNANKGGRMVLVGKRRTDKFQAKLRIKGWTEGLKKEIGISYKKITINSDGEHYVDSMSENEINNILVGKNFEDFIFYSNKMAKFDSKNFSELFAYFLIARRIAENIYERSTTEQKKVIEKWRNNENLFETLDEYLKSGTQYKNEGEWSLIFEVGKEARFIKSLNKSLVFQKSITRDWPLFIVEMLHNGFTKEFKKQFNWNYSEVLFDIYSDHLDIYRAPTEHMEKMREFILAELDKDLNFISKCSKTSLKFYKGFLELVEQIDKTNLLDLSGKELASLLNKFIEVHTKLEPTFVINFWFPIQMENYADKNKYKNQIAIAAKTRAETEKVGPEGDRIARKFAQEIVKRIFNENKYAKFISLNEAYNFLLNGKLPNRKDLEKRRIKGFVYGSRGVKFIKIKEYAESEGYVIKTVEVIDNKIIKGNIAYPGLVRGKVRIVISKNNIDIVKEGEILVTAMTTPEFMPALKKAAAFVTDEGGITSHAAIVSRELKKPCIIGTKIATQLLKNGDLIEVDANIGIIRIMNKVN